jgi:hypothetical protein
MLAFRDVFLFLGLVFFFAMMPAILLRERQRGAPPSPLVGGKAGAMGAARS